jgi:hypothetical protein
MPVPSRWTVTLIGLAALWTPGMAATARAQAIGFLPTPVPFPSGVTLGVTPVVSADRRYVRVGVNAYFNDVAGFTNYSVPAAVGGGGAMGMNGLIGGGGGAGPGAGAGLRAMGVGGPILAGSAPPLSLASPTGDPFEKALRGDGMANEAPQAGAPAEDNPPVSPRARGRRPLVRRGRAVRPLPAVERRKAARPESNERKAATPIEPTTMDPLTP